LSSTQWTRGARTRIYTDHTTKGSIRVVNNTVLPGGGGRSTEYKLICVKKKVGNKKLLEKKRTEVNGTREAKSDVIQERPWPRT
jgi:hypothetical protein